MYIVSHRGFMVVVFLSCLPDFFRFSHKNDFIPAPSGSLGLKGSTSITVSVSHLQGACSAHIFITPHRPSSPVFHIQKTCMWGSYRWQSLLLKVVVFCFLLPMLCPLVPPYAETSPSLPVSPLYTR